ncbi:MULTISPECIES: hypothetical protein [unclassified Micromonospora]|uniref:hypothetical protein n=1 Tax=unclassified Micromonospora TaxID=2617518 RepID=UPI00363ED710
MSTIEHQDRVASRHWQRDCATELVADHEMIVAEYFDVGCSRQPTNRRRKVLYLREDHIIARLAGHPRLSSDAQSPHDLAALLHRTKITIVCDQEHCEPITGSIYAAQQAET